MGGGHRGRPGADPADRRVAAQQAPAPADARGRPLPRRADQPLPGLPGVPGRALGRTSPGSCSPAPPRPTRPGAAPPCCRRWRRSPPPAGARSPSSRWGPRPGSPCFRTATATSTTPAPGVTRLAPAGAAPGSYPVLRCAVTGPVPLPAELPRVVWRAGIDLNPLDVRNPDDVAWLEALIWPEQDFRRERLRRAIAVARADPPLLVAGDLNDQLRRPGRAGAAGRHPGGLPQRGHGLPRCGGAGPVPAPPWRGSPSNAAATGSPTRGTR